MVVLPVTGFSAEVLKVKQRLLKTMGSVYCEQCCAWTADITSGPKNVLAWDQA